MLEWVKSFGLLGWELMYFACQKDMNFGDTQDGVLWTELHYLQIHMLCPNPQFLTTRLSLEIGLLKG